MPATSNAQCEHVIALYGNYKLLKILVGTLQLHAAGF